MSELLTQFITEIGERRDEEVKKVLEAYRREEIRTVEDALQEIKDLWMVFFRKKAEAETMDSSEQMG